MLCWEKNTESVVTHPSISPRSAPHPLCDLGHLLNIPEPQSICKIRE